MFRNQDYLINKEIHSINYEFSNLWIKSLSYYQDFEKCKSNIFKLQLKREEWSLSEILQSYDRGSQINQSDAQNVSLLCINEKNYDSQIANRLQKFHIKSSDEKQLLNTRYDVMNKNFIRFIKREIRSFFCWICER